jgi:hypothetical protein
MEQTEQLVRVLFGQRFKMQLILHSSSQETTTGNSGDYIEPDFAAIALIINVSAISLQLFGNIVMKVQHSADGSNWFDIPNLATGNITATGALTVSLAGGFATGDHIRLVWTFTNANSITFTAFAVGVK